MKRGDLIRHLKATGCEQLREGGNHTIYVNRSTRRELSCPPEDVGGPFGYIEFLQAFAHKTHPGHEEMVDWAGEYFDPERFDLSEANEMLAER